LSAIDWWSRSEMRASAIVVAVLANLLTACAPEPIEFPDWTIPVPEGTPILEYAAVPMEERTERIELAEDLVIGQRGDDPNYILYRPGHVIADSEGRIFVLDRGNFRIQIYDSEGECLMTLGQQGQGPGEFLAINGLALTGDRIVAVDRRNSRYTVFAAGGELLDTIPYNRSIGTVFRLTGLTDGSALAMRTYPPPEVEEWELETSRRGLALLSKEMTLVKDIVEFPEYREPMAIRGSPGSVMAGMVVSLPHPVHQAIATPSGEVYAAITSEYQVFSFRPDGQMVWALRVPWPRSPITDEEIEGEIAAFRSRRGWGNFDRSGYEWPELRPALERIAVDGKGNLYVYLHPSSTEDENEERMVDVYSPDGEHLFSGLIPPITWRSAGDDYVYTLESDDQTGDERVVRYRLVEPF